MYDELVRFLLFALAVSGSLAAQPQPLSIPVEQEKGFLGDSFKLGVQRENWMMDSIRLCAILDTSPARATGKPGDRIAKRTLHGGLYNPPVPGQPECDCHSLVPVISAPVEKGGSRFAHRSSMLTAEAALWQIDFKDVPWRVPSGLDVLVPSRAESRAAQAYPADPDHRLRFFDKALVPAGFAGPMSPLRQLQIQVKEHTY